MNVEVEVPLPAVALALPKGQLVVELVRDPPSVEVVVGEAVVVRVPVEADGWDWEAVKVKVARKQGLVRVSSTLRDGAPAEAHGEPPPPPAASASEKVSIGKPLMGALRAAMKLERDSDARMQAMAAHCQAASQSAAGREVLMAMPVTSASAVEFAAALGAVMDGAGGPAAAPPPRQLAAVPWSPAAYAAAAAAAQPVLFGGSPPSGLRLRELLRQGGGVGGGGPLLSVKWPQHALPNMHLPVAALQPFFDHRYPKPPNIVDAAIPPEMDYAVPPIVRATNLLVSVAEVEGLMSVKPDLVASPAGAVTRFHIDSGLAVWNDHSEGMKDWAMCNLTDGHHLGLHNPSTQVTLEEFLQVPSARVCRLTPGYSLYLPGGYYHFIFTRRPSIAVSNNVIVLGSLPTAAAIYSANTDLWGETGKRMVATHREAMQRTTAACRNGSLRAELTPKCGLSEEEAEEYIQACMADTSFP